jgi:radical SAM protein with 4Fe4S-binding SPASM domain
LDFSVKDIMPFDEVCNYLDQLAEHGCPAVTFTGGEIFLRKDLMEIVSYASQKGFSILLLTNGNFIDAKRADELAKCCVDTVQISIYGTTAATHELVTRKPGTFDQSINAARLLIDRGVRVLLSYFVQHDNVEEAFGFEEFARKLGAHSKFDTKLVPNRNGSKELLRYAVTMQQMAELFRSGIMGYETDFLCTAAVGKVRITANGEVYPCELINTASMGNLRRQTLADIWNSHRRKSLREEILAYKPNRCKSCSHTADCEPCAAMRGFNQPDHMEAPVSEACFLTTANLLSKGKNVTDTKFFQQQGSDCISNLLQGEPASKHSTLVQIMVARSSDAAPAGDRKSP